MRLDLGKYYYALLLLERMELIRSLLCLSLFVFIHLGCADLVVMQAIQKLDESLLS